MSQKHERLWKCIEKEKQLLQLEVFLNVEKDTINDFTDKSKVYER